MLALAPGCDVGVGDSTWGLTVASSSPSLYAKAHMLPDFLCSQHTLAQADFWPLVHLSP